jgi:predicted dehydrogenase
MLPVSSPGLTETQIWEQFAAATRGEGNPAVSVESVLPTMALLDAARESSHTGRAVDLDQQIEWEY